MSRTVLITLFVVGTLAPADSFSGEVTVPSDGDEVQALRDVAASEGLVRIIVELLAPIDAPGTPLFQEEVEEAQTQLRSAVSGQDAPLFDPVPGQPLVIMEVTGGGLDSLLRQPIVRRITADTLSQPNQNQLDINDAGEVELNR